MIGFFSKFLGDSAGEETWILPKLEWVKMAAIRMGIMSLNDKVQMCFRSRVWQHDLSILI